MPGGDTEVSIGDVSNIASVAAKVLGSTGRHIVKAYNITEPKGLSYYQAAEMLSNAIGIM